MMNLLHPAQTDSAPTASAAPDAVDAAENPLPSVGGSTDTREPDVRTDAREHSPVPDDALSPEVLRALSTRQLRVLVNQAYKLMDTDYPPAGTSDRYAMIVDELELRAQPAEDRGHTHQPKEAFRDNALYCRFELIIDGTIAAYLKYTMHGAQIILVDGVEQPGFRDQGIDTTLMRHVVLNAHKRRLGLVPRCPMAFSFLADHPQYQVLTARSTR